MNDSEACLKAGWAFHVLVEVARVSAGGGLEVQVGACLIDKLLREVVFFKKLTLNGPW